MRADLPASPLIDSDDLPLHQTAETLLRVGTHPKWTERWYFNLQEGNGTLRGICGGGFYPNTGILEVYACVLVDGHQHNLRQRVREFNRERLDSANAVTFMINEAMRRWSARASCDRFELTMEFSARHQPYLFPPFFVAADLPHESGPLEFDTIQHFVQPGDLVATVTVDGTATSIAGLSFRDRTWGVRTARPRLHQWYVLHLEGGGYLNLIHQERADGTPMVSHIALVGADGRESRAVIDTHDLHFDPYSRLLRNGVYTAHDAGGAVVGIEVENAGEGVRLLGAGYTRAQGDAERLGEPQTDSWDLTDPEVGTRVGRGTIDSPVRAQIVWGDRAWNAVGITETAIARNHWRYGSTLA